jgi:uracil-DNA glycosylase family 4
VQVETFPSIVSSRRIVPNEHPIREPATYHIAIIGESPGEDEENYRRPFVGKSGQFLTNILRDVGIDRQQCLVGNVCQVRPPQNRIEAFSWDGPEIQEGLAKLNEDIRVYNPNIVVCLGGTPLRAARGQAKITEWRGSLFRSTLVDSPFSGRKCLGSLHPAFVLREFSGFPLLKFDLTRAASEGRTPELNLPQRELITNLSADEICYLLDTWPSGKRCSIDIEGGLPRWMVNERELELNKKRKPEDRRLYHWPCVSVCARPTRSYTIAWYNLSEQNHARCLQSYARLMERRDVPKVLQNSLYDNFVNSFGYGILIRHVSEDVMIKSWELYAELPRALSVQASIWTKEPRWKDETMYGSVGNGLYRGCATDTAVTLEICEAQDQVIKPASRRHYEKMIELLNPFLYMELRGVKYDKNNATRLAKDNDQKLFECAERINQVAGRELQGKKGSLSAKRLIQCLYKEKNYEPQFKREEGRKTDKLTSDIEALLTLKRKHPVDSFLDDLIYHRHLEGIRETLAIETDADGRVRCAYSLEAETGRVKCYTSPTGSGTNLQTIQKSLRGNYIADDGYDFAHFDLEGADGWTIACRCASLGDTTMLEDYLAKLKPAKLIALMYWFGSQINQLSREDLKWCHDHLFPLVLEQAGKWLYLGCKRVQHGSSYLMGIPTMVLNVLKDSHKESGRAEYMEHSTARSLQDGCFFARYKGIRKVHAWAESFVRATGEFTACNGHTRIFFGRRFGRDIKDTVKEFLAHEPQMNTTWATNMAALNLWNDRENRRMDGSLVIEPLHQVHDALCVQWPSERRDWAVNKMKQYFNNSLTIAGQTITIPYDGSWGKSWGDTPNQI